MSVSKPGGKLAFSAMEDGKNEPEQNNHSGMGRELKKRRRGRRRRGRNPLGRHPDGCRLNEFLHDDDYFGDLTEDYRLQMDRYCRKAFNQLEMLNLPTNPELFEKKYIRTLYDKGTWASEHDRHMTLTRFRVFLTWTGFNWPKNYINLEPPPPYRPRYNLDELKRKKRHVVHPYERFMDHIEVDYCQRMCTVIRAQISDFKGETVLLRVKGKGGRQTMTAPKHEDTDAIIAEVMKEREDVLERCRRKGWNGTPPPNLLIHKWKGAPKTYTESGLEEMLKRVCARAGVPYKAHHANRRGSGRAIYDATKDPIMVQSVLGHKDLQTTLIYIGVDAVRQKEGQKALKKALR